MDKIVTRNINNNSHEVIYNNETQRTISYSTQDKSNCIVRENIKYDSCTLCKKVDILPIDIQECSGRVLQANLTINNVCFGKKLAIGVIIRNKCKEIIAFKAFTITLQKKSGCADYDDSCGTLTHKLFFVLPESDICSPFELNISVIANYSFNCESSC